MHGEMPKMPKRVSVEEVENGYIVRGYDSKGNEKQMVCKDMEEAHAAMVSMMGKKGEMAEYKEPAKRTAKYKVKK